MNSTRLYGDQPFVYAGTIYGRRAAVSGKFKSQQKTSQPQYRYIFAILVYILLLASVTVSLHTDQFPWFMAAVGVFGLISLVYPKSALPGETR